MERRILRYDSVFTKRTAHVIVSYFRKFINIMRKFVIIPTSVMITIYIGHL